MPTESFIVFTPYVSPQVFLPVEVVMDSSSGFPFFLDSNIILLSLYIKKSPVLINCKVNIVPILQNPVKLFQMALVVILSTKQVQEM